MQVRVISISKALIFNEEGIEMTAEELIVYIARVSSNQRTEKAEKLIRYLIGHKHWSPFEMANLCVEVITSRAIAHQILRHWSLSVQEFSQRYAEVVDIEPVQLRKTGSTNRQSSLEVFDPHIKDNNLMASDMVAAHLDNSVYIYKKLLEAGVAKECARMVLPLTTQTKMYLNGSVRDWIHYLGQRTSEHTQLEHREVAFGIEEIFKYHFPNISQALKPIEKE